jgi:hypothetical protein
MTPTEADLCTGGRYISAELHREAFAVGASVIVADADNNSAPGRELKKPEDSSCAVGISANLDNSAFGGIRWSYLESIRKAPNSPFRFLAG